MSRGVIVIAGYGTGISHGVAAKFGSEGFTVALLSRTQSKLDDAAAELKKQGISAKGFAVDLSSFEGVKSTINKISSELGPVTVLFWNPYGKPASLLEATEEDFLHEFKLTTTGLVAAVQAAYDDLKAQAGKSAVLVTGGAASLELDPINTFVTSVGWYTFATAKASQRKLVALLNKTLGKDGIYAAEATVMGAVKGTPFDADGTSTITVEAVAEKFWDLYTQRDADTWVVQVAGN